MVLIVRMNGTIFEFRVICAGLTKGNNISAPDRGANYERNYIAFVPVYLNQLFDLEKTVCARLQ